MARGAARSGSNNAETPKSRLFFGSQFLSQLLKNNLKPLETVTSTFLTTIASTVTLVSVKSCIGPLQFSTNNAVIPPALATTFTAACSRKRRGISIEEMEALEAIEPAQVEP